MPNQEVGDINKTGRGVLFVEQPDGTFAEKVISSGSASGIDWLTELRAGRAFAGFDNSPATASNISMVQLFNPAASGVNVLVRHFRSEAGASALIEMRFFDTLFANLGPVPKNLLSGGAASQARTRNRINTVGLGDPAFAEFSMITNSEDPRLGGEWVAELAPGKGFHLSGTSVNVFLRTSFWWVEIPIVP